MFYMLWIALPIIVMMFGPLVLFWSIGEINTKHKEDLLAFLGLILFALAGTIILLSSFYQFFLKV